MGTENYWDIDLGDLGDMDLNLDDITGEDKSLIVSTKTIPSKMIKYENAEKLTERCDLSKQDRFDCIVKGDFISGDFLFALFVKYGIHTKELTISTLSMNLDNIFKLRMLIEWGAIDKIRILASIYFYANERNLLIKALFDNIPPEKLECAFVDVHTKIITFETDGGKKIVISGSANLRSSGCTENFIIENNAQAFDFYNGYHNDFFNIVKIRKKNVLRNTVTNKMLFCKD